MTNENQNLRIQLLGSVMVAAALAVSAPLGAGENPTTFEALDADGDGYISSKEAAMRKDLEERWTMIDKNADNQLDMTEFSAFESIESKGYAVPPPGEGQ